jgi:hypothetical protein
MIQAIHEYQRNVAELSRPGDREQAGHRPGPLAIPAAGNSNGSSLSG